MDRVGTVASLHPPLPSELGYFTPVWVESLGSQHRSTYQPRRWPQSERVRVLAETEMGEMCPAECVSEPEDCVERPAQPGSLPSPHWPQLWGKDES